MSLDDYPIDTDYCDVDDPERADVSVTEHDDDLERKPPDDRSWTYDTSNAGTLAGSDWDEEIDTNAVIANDGRSQTRTMYYPWEGNGTDTDKLWRLLKLNDGMRSPERRQQNEQADNNRWIDSFATQLSLTEHQRERVRFIIDNTDLRRMGPYSAQEAILACISIVCNEDDRWVRDEDHYKQLVGDIDSDLYKIRNVRGLLRRKCPKLDGSDG